MRRRHAFTLVELLVVIGIISVLLIIIFPVIGKSRTRAMTTKCASNARQLALFLQLYANDHNGNFPPAMDINSATPLFWSDYLRPYSVSMQPTLDDGSTAIGRKRDPKSVFNCPAVPYNKDNQLAPYGVDYANTIGYTFAVSAARWRYTRSRVPAASETILVGDMVPDGNYEDQIATYDNYRIETAGSPLTDSFVSSGEGQVSPRHDGMANMAFVDAHVEVMSPTNLNRNSSKWIWYTIP
ncbi:MAG TPA: prepilin-type N-terminal cleavage/methylation domain-containing protein [Kiritimatiellia bacterium]|jgi:prepilin-type processing-associated H-X9-DG protein/prepilin-type N-terminal cleavage/methylation domain-containing protein